MTSRLRWVVLALVLGCGGGNGSGGDGSVGPDAGDAATVGDGGTDGGLTPDASTDGSSDGAAPCNPSPCTEHETCRVDGSGEAVCECGEGTRELGSACVPTDDWFGIAGSELSPRAMRLESSVRYGGVSQSATGVGSLDMALDDMSRPIVAWTFQGVFLKGWDGAAFTPIGDSVGGTGIAATSSASDVDVATGPDGMPQVAWSTTVGADTHVYFKRWNGTAWEELAGSASDGGVGQSTLSGGDTCGPSLAVDGAGRPVVAWAEAGAASEIYLRRWEESAWEEIAGSGSDGGISATPSESSDCPTVAVDPMDRPVVAWEEAGRIWVRRFDGVSWVAMGGSATGDGISPNPSDETARRPRIHIDGDDRVTVAWTDERSFSVAELDTAYLRRWNGASWEELDGSASGSGLTGDATSDGYSSSLASRGDELWVAFGHTTSDRRISRVRVKRFGGSTLTELPELHPATDPGGNARLAVGADGLFAAWTGDGNAFVQRFVDDEAGWAPVGPDPDIIGGIATPMGEDAGEDGARVPSLTLDGNSPAVVYRLRPMRGGPQELHVAAPNDAATSWEERGVFSERTAELLEGELVHEDGVLHVSWPFWGSEAGISLWRDDGADWTEVVRDTAPDSVQHGRVAFADEALYAVWSVSRDGVHAGQWNGVDTFEGFGVDGATRIADDDQSSTGDGPRIATAPDGTVWAAWRRGSELHLAALGEAGFEEVEALTSLSSAAELDLAVDPEGRPTVAYPAGGDIGVQRWNGSGWEGIDDSELAGGISQTARARRPRLAVGADGTLAVAWADSGTGSGEIYAVVHTAAGGWQGIAGSNEGGGVSNSGVQSVEPSIAIGPEVVCVAWSEGGFVTMRCALLPT